MILTLNQNWTESWSAKWLPPVFNAETEYLVDFMHLDLIRSWNVMLKTYF